MLGQLIRSFLYFPVIYSTKFGENKTLISSELDGLRNHEVRKCMQLHGTTFLGQNNMNYNVV